MAIPRRLAATSAIAIAGAGTVGLGAAGAGLASLTSPRISRRTVGVGHPVHVRVPAGGRVSLTGPEAVRPGWWGLSHPTGWSLVGPPSPDGTRPQVALAGTDPHDGVNGRLHADLIGPDPSVLDLDWARETVVSPVGELPLLRVAADGIPLGTGGDVAVFVHGRAGRDRNGLSLVPTLAEAGWETALVSYRNDEGAPATGRYLLGGEWEDLAAVVEHLRASGEVRRLLLIGWSMGGNIVCSYLRHVGGDGVAGVVLDAPALQWRDILHHVARNRHLPPALVGVVLGLGRATAGLDWAVLDHLADVAHLDELPTLLFHGDDDDLVPMSIPERLVERLHRADLIVTEGGGHCRSLNVDPVRYLAELRRFATAV